MIKLSTVASEGDEGQGAERRWHQRVAGLHRAVVGLHGRLGELGGREWWLKRRVF